MNDKSEIDIQLQNKNLSESERKVLELAKECGIKRLI